MVPEFVMFYAGSLALAIPSWLLLRYTRPVFVVLTNLGPDARDEQLALAA